MKSIRRGVSVFQAALLAIVTVLVFPGTANASSDYDNVITITNHVSLEQNSSHGSTRADISYNWYNIFSNCDNWTSSADSYGANCNTANDALSDALSQGYGWAVVERTAKSNFSIGDVNLYSGDKFVSVIFNPGADTNAVFRDSYYGKGLHATGSSYTYGFNIVLTNNPSDAVPVVSNGQRTIGFSSDFTIIDDSDTFNFWSSDVYFSNIPTTYPSGYAGTVIPKSPPPAKYVAMGDSFSSGEGNAPYESETDQDGDRCHRSPAAYPRRVQNMLDLGTTAFVACSGATIHDILNNNSNNVEYAQSLFVSPQTNIVSMSIGGNDVNFGPAMQTCTVRNSPTTDQTMTGLTQDQIDQADCMETLGTSASLINSTLGASLTSLYVDVESLASSAKLLIVGYPQLFPEYSNISANCTWGSSFIPPLNGVGTPSGRAVSSTEVSTIRSLITQMNNLIQTAVSNANNSNIVFVDPTATFAGHELCTDTPWLNGVVLNVDPAYIAGSYHPNADGQSTYASMVATTISSLTTP